MIQPYKINPNELMINEDCIFKLHYGKNHCNKCKHRFTENCIKSIRYAIKQNKLE